MYVVIIDAEWSPGGRRPTSFVDGAIGYWVMYG